MAQYAQYGEGVYQYRTLTDGRKVRRGQRSGAFVEDIEWEVGGFLLAQNVGWEEISSQSHTPHGGKYREGIRSTQYVLDGENSTGVWEQII